MAQDSNINAPELRARAVRAAQGLEPFDLLISNARLLDMVTGRERDADIGIVGGLIASVRKAGSKADAIASLDAGGRFVVPGFIDTHMHVESSMVTPAEYAAAVVPRGVTTIVWDPHEFANACGLAGVDYAIDAGKELPLRLLTLAPTCVPSAPGFEASGGDFDPDLLTELLARPDIHGAAELMTMQPLLNGSDRVQGIVNAGLASGKRVCGHARGLNDGALSAYAAAGVETDHELSSAEDLIARLEAGMTVELRGSHEHLLPEFAKAILDLGHLPQTLTLCTDDVFPDDLQRQGGLDNVIRLMIRFGLPPEWAYRAATLNAATRIRRPDLGLIAPGKRADIVLLDDLAQVKPSLVVADGKTVSEDGNLTMPCRSTEPPAALRNSVSVAEFQADDLEIQAPGSSAQIAVLSKPRFPVWGSRTVDVEAGKLILPDDMIRMAVANRYGQNAPVRVAFLEKWGRWRGAFATTVSHDSHNLTVFGRDPSDMALAANTVRSSNGGMCVVAKGEVIEKIELPLAGLVSEAPLSEIAVRFAALRKALDALVDWEPPYLVFKALFGASLVCNAGPRLSDVGIIDVFKGRVLETPVLSLDSTAE
ncbi:adenine deaminase C-terminal domain-containing protein [uncultured Roseibium sp.]|uniref:adenine deaminase n=1 Tax=uncultured Roseibium sp. TaxID=1936171 RepID=UPI00260C42A2|nr:adenine deaminase C-terminal domain-containing protein [uncultured Roseibium sp.]